VRDDDEHLGSMDDDARDWNRISVQELNNVFWFYLRTENRLILLEIGKRGRQSAV
jgi:hypothetical protein